MQNYMKERLTQNKFETFPKITKRSNRCKLYITYMDVFCICRWNFYGNDSEKGKGLLVACCAVCDEYVNKKGSVFGRERPRKMEM